MRNRIILLILLSPLWIPLFIVLGAMFLIVGVPLFITSVFVGLLEWGFTGDSKLLKFLFSKE